MADICTSGANALTFTFSTQALRVVMIDGEPWFVASDVCGALALENTTKALLRLDDDEQALISIQGISRGNDQVNVINESGLYSLVLGSRKPEAKKFKKWVTSEVLPAIRKTGRYVAATAKPEPQPAPPHAGREQLNAADMQNIKRLIWLVADRMGRTSSWTQAIWCHLRHALNHPAPHPFYADQLPAIQREMIQVLNTALQVKEIMHRLEKEAATRIFRRGEMASSVLIMLDIGAKNDMAKLRSNLSADYSWIEQDLLQLTQRAQPNMGIYYVANEQPDFFRQAA